MLLTCAIRLGAQVTSPDRSAAESDAIFGQQSGLSPLRRLALLESSPRGMRYTTLNCHRTKEMPCQTYRTFH